MIWGISCLHFCKKSADHKEGNTCSEVPIDIHLSKRDLLAQNHTVVNQQCYSDWKPFSNISIKHWPRSSSEESSHVIFQ